MESRYSVFSIRNLLKSTVPELGLKKNSYSMTIIRLDLIRYDIIDCIYCLWYWVLSTNYSVFRPFGVTVKWTDWLTLLQKRLLTQDTKLKHSIWIGFHSARAKATLDQAQTRISTLQGRVVLVTSPLSNGSPQLIIQIALQNRISAIGTGIGCIRLLLPQNVTGIKGEFPGTEIHVPIG